jgi:hypothetical protein
MTLFALLGLPAFLITVYGLTVASHAVVGRSASPSLAPRLPMVDFLKGLVYGVVGAVSGILLQRFLPLSYRFVPMFLYYLVVDHLVMAALAVAMMAAAYRKRSVVEMVFFAGGFYAVVAVGAVLRSYGSYEEYSLFLRPALYMASVLYLPLFLAAAGEWTGVARVLYAAAVAGVPIVAAGIALLQRTFYEPWAAAATAVFVVGAGAVFFYSSRR